MKLSVWSFALTTVVSFGFAAPLEDRLFLTPPSEDSFYSVPDNINQNSPGAILKHRTPPHAISALGVAPVNLQASHQILYRTTDSLDAATATVLTVLVPHNADFGKVLSYQPVIDAASIDCAVSYALQIGSKPGGLFGTTMTQAEFLLTEAALQQGWIVILPDYQGPKAAFLAGKMAGQATLDGIRAALASGDITGIKPDAKVGLWGYSGGAIATGWAAELHPTYAPELKLVGAVVGGAVPNITNAVTKLNRSQLSGTLFGGIWGLANQYAEADQIINKHILPQHKKAFSKTHQQCLAANCDFFPFTDVMGMFDDPTLFYTQPDIVKIMDANAMGQKTPKVPMLMYKSRLDELSPIVDTDKLYDYYCANGATIQYERDLASLHISLAITGGTRALAYLVDRMDGKPLAGGCSKKDVISELLNPGARKLIPKFILDMMLSLLHAPVGPH